MVMEASYSLVPFLPAVTDMQSEIYEGEPGSWIVVQKTLEVYGHLVAPDALGYGYVIPLSETFRNIMQQLGAVSVNLPSAIDIFCLNTTVMYPRTIFYPVTIG
jgi:hypothetical protein